MPVAIQIPPPLRPHAGGRDVVAVEAATVEAALAALVAAEPGLQPRLYANGALRPFVNVYLNDDDVRYLDNGFATPIKDGDQLAIIPAVGGG
ncbi:MAG: ubiquitin-like small modifier protein 1 [Planctomycetota bacterium]